MRAGAFDVAHRKAHAPRLVDKQSVIEERCLGLTRLYAELQVQLSLRARRSVPCHLAETARQRGRLAQHPRPNDRELRRGVDKSWIEEPLESLWFHRFASSQIKSEPVGRSTGQNLGVDAKILDRVDRADKLKAAAVEEVTPIGFFGGDALPASQFADLRRDRFGKLRNELYDALIV